VRRNWIISISSKNGPSLFYDQYLFYFIASNDILNITLFKILNDMIIYSNIC
jgi:hypothetical protein